MAFLQPDEALEFTVSVYVIVCSLGILIWDILHSLTLEYRLAFKPKLRGWSTIAYFLSRMAALGYLTGETIQHTTRFANCRLANRVLSGFFIAAKSFTALLFYFRISQVYHGCRVIIALFAGLWMVAVACYSLTWVSSTSISIGQTRLCMKVIQDARIQASIWAGLSYDTLVFLAILYKFLMQALIPGTECHFSKIFFQRSQLSYLYAVVLDIAALAVYFGAHATSSSLRLILMGPNVAVVNIMACRVYRLTKIGTRKTRGTFVGGTDLTGDNFTFKVPTTQHESISHSDSGGLSDGARTLRRISSGGHGVDESGVEAKIELVKDDRSDWSVRYGQAL
ncbi:unnamed protein product [Cyclocybe aegerita]|uniref:DUF6533 domain-containing protein n=1 Tax=Cyclocybe aegerita TaxID=1973307 RepID=A0A8S0VYJ3_CYCAE|nr:unnamed protein product [Cyclocybe aegerita]